jgi:hypothetical protein
MINNKRIRMGQYFVAVMIDDDGKLYAVETFVGDGAKLTEHAYDGSRIIRVVENLLRPGGAWYMKRVAWAGDYAEPEQGSEYNLYHMPDKVSMNYIEPLDTPLQYVVNHDKMVFVDKRKVREMPDRYVYHPLPLLTSEGNGRGGGDYRGADTQGLMGSWARDRISIEAMHPPQEFSEIIFDLAD